MDNPKGRIKIMPRAGGFTLIELLVVTAIIGILSSIVLVALSGQRSSAADASIKSNLSMLRTQGEIYAIANGNSYGSFNGGVASTPGSPPNASICLSQTSGNLFADSTIKAALIAAQSASGGQIRCIIDSTGNWAVAVALKSTPGTSWCVASNGVAKTIPTANALVVNSCLF